MDKLQPYCPGTGCPLKENCMRYRDNIDVKKEPHFPNAPYSMIRQKCEFFVGDPTLAVKSILDKSIDQSEPSDGAFCE